MSLPSEFWRHVNRTTHCWEWRGAVSDMGVPQYLHPTKGRWENAVRYAYRQRHPLGRSRSLFRTCGSNTLCVRPDHHLTLDRLSPKEQVAVVLADKVEVTMVCGREHWVWTGRNKRNPQVSVDGETYRAVAWGHRLLFPEKHVQGKRLYKRLDVCNLAGCVNPACFGYRGEFRKLYQVKRTGYATPCHIGLGPRNDDGYVRHKGDYLHRVRYVRETGNHLGEGIELHHRCGEPACCRPDHVEPLDRDDHRTAERARRAEKHRVPA